jgi:hypothetical protein
MSLPGLPPFHADNEADRVAMREYVLGRVFEDVDQDYVRARLLEAADNRKRQPLPDDVYASAKRAAREGNLQPLGELLSVVMDDPEIVAFLAVPPRGRGKRKNNRQRQLLFLERAANTTVVDLVRGIRQIWREDFGKVKRNSQYDESAEKIAGYVYGLSEQAVLQIMKKARPA